MLDSLCRESSRCPISRRVPKKLRMSLRRVIHRLLRFAILVMPLVLGSTAFASTKGNPNSLAGNWGCLQQGAFGNENKAVSTHSIAQIVQVTLGNKNDVRLRRLPCGIRTDLPVALSRTFWLTCARIGPGRSELMPLNHLERKLRAGSSPAPGTKFLQ